MNVSNKAFNTLAPADYSFWNALNQVVQEGYWYPNSTWRMGFVGGYKFEEQPGSRRQWIRGRLALGHNIWLRLWTPRATP